MTLDPKIFNRIAVVSALLIVLLSAIYVSVTKNILENLSVASIIILLIIYLRQHHPSYKGLILHVILLFSLGLIPMGYPISHILLLFMSVSFVFYVFAFSDALSIDTNRWPYSSFILVVTSFLGFILAFMNVQIVIVSILLLVTTTIIGGVIYLEVKRKIQIANQMKVSILEGETVRKDILFSNKSKILVHVLIKVKRIDSGINVRVPKINVKPRETIRIPLIISASESGIHDIYLDFFIEDVFHLTRLYQTVKVTVKVMPKVKMALLAARKLLVRIPSEVLEHADVRSIGEVELVPKVLSSRRGEYYGARQYVPGDDLSQIHWKKSLSKGILISKEMKKIHSYSIALLVDLTSFSNRDFTDILYKALTSLILISLRDPLRIVTLALYDMENVYLVIKNNSAAKALNNLIKTIENGSIGTHRVYGKVLDKPIILSILSSDNVKLKILYDVLIDSIREKYAWKIITEVLKDFDGRNIQIIHGQGVVNDLYYYIKLLLRRKGYTLEEPVEIGPKLLYEKVIAEPVGLSV